MCAQAQLYKSAEGMPAGGGPYDGGRNKKCLIPGPRFDEWSLSPGKEGLEDQIFPSPSQLFAP